MKVITLAGGDQAITSNDEPRPRTRTAKEIITGRTVDELAAKRKAEAEKGADNED